MILAIYIITAKTRIIISELDPRYSRMMPEKISLYNLGLEFLWRLRVDTKRRLKRLIQTSNYFLKGYLDNKFEKIKIEKI